MRRLLENLQLGVLEIDDHWFVCYANRAAQRIVEAGDALRFVDGRLGFLKTAERERFGRWLRDLGYGLLHYPLALPRASGRAPYVLYQLPAERGTPDPGDSTFLLLLHDPARKPRIAPMVLMQVYGLTRAEAALSSAIAAGDSLEEYAAKANIAIATARRHLERVFLKTGVERQAQLVGLVLACMLPGVCIDDDSANSTEIVGRGRQEAVVD